MGLRDVAATCCGRNCNATALLVAVVNRSDLKLLHFSRVYVYRLAATLKTSGCCC